MIQTNVFRLWHRGPAYSRVAWRRDWGSDEDRAPSGKKSQYCTFLLEYCGDSKAQSQSLSIFFEWSFAYIYIYTICVLLKTHRAIWGIGIGPNSPLKYIFKKSFGNCAFFKVVFLECSTTGRSIDILCFLKSYFLKLPFYTCTLHLFYSPIYHLSSIPSYPPVFLSLSVFFQAWVANFERPRMNANSLLASPTGLSPYLRFGCLSCRLFYFKLTDLYRKVSLLLTTTYKWNPFQTSVFLA